MRSPVPDLIQGLRCLSSILSIAESHCANRKIDQDALLKARLFPDMFHLTRNVTTACDSAKFTAARLSQAEPPRYEDHPRCRFRCRRNAGAGSAACARRNGSRRADLSRTLRIAELLLSSCDGLQHLAPQWCAPRKARLSLGELNRSKSSPVYGMRLSDQTVNAET
jgi:hypothetical protein